MTPEDALNFLDHLPADITVDGPAPASHCTAEMPPCVDFATEEWLLYVMAMAQAVPRTGDWIMPTIMEARFPFPEDGVNVVFEKPIDFGMVPIRRTEARAEDDDEDALPADGSLPDDDYVLMSVVAEAVSFCPNPDLLDDTTNLPVDWTHHQWSAPGDEPVAVVLHHVGGKRTLNIVVGGTKYDAAQLFTMRHARLTTSLFIALGHRLTSASLMPLPRNKSKRRRMRNRAPVRVLKLNGPLHPHNPNPNSQTINWTHRWLVKGHWRNQPYGSKKHPQYRTIWIDPFVKGPEHLPIDVRSTVYESDG